MIPFKLSNGIKFEFPQDYGEMTLKQFFAIRSLDPDLKEYDRFMEIFSILSGLDRSVVDNISDLDMDFKVGKYMEFLLEPFDGDLYPVPDQILIGGKWCKRPEGIGMMAWGQKVALEAELRAKNYSDIDTLPYAIALYMQPVYYDNGTELHSQYDHRKVEELLPIVMNCKVESAWPLGSFFLINYVKYLTRNQSPLAQKEALRKSLQGLIGSRNTVTSARYSIFRRASVFILKKLVSLSITLYYWYLCLRRIPTNIKDLYIKFRVPKILRDNKHV